MSETKRDSSPTTTAQSEAASYQPSGELQNIKTAYRLNGKNYLKWSQNSEYAHLSTVKPDEIKSQEKGEFNQEEIEKLKPWKSSPHVLAH